MSGEKDWIWLPHPAHFIGAPDCSFRMATKVGNVIVSTVGEYMPAYMRYIEQKKTFEEIGFNRLFETMVFKVQPSECQACLWEITDAGHELDIRGYNSPEDAFNGHYEICRKWDLKQGDT